jgi:hypothetical protein
MATDYTNDPFSVTVAQGESLPMRVPSATPSPRQLFVAYGITPRPLLVSASADEFANACRDWLKGALDPIVGPTAAATLLDVLSSANQQGAFYGQVRDFLVSKIPEGERPSPSQ